MTALERVQKVETQMELTPEMSAMVEKRVPALLEDLEREGVFFDESGDIGFISHAISLVKRLESGEKVKDLGEEVLAQLEEGAVALARRVLEPLEEAYATALDRTELALVAIHVQTAMANAEKRKGG